MYIKRKSGYAIKNKKSEIFRHSNSKESSPIRFISKFKMKWIKERIIGRKWNKIIFLVKWKCNLWNF
jgi:hypothetical protein